jgi:hypothetical protein
MDPVIATFRWGSPAFCQLGLLSLKVPIFLWHFGGTFLVPRMFERWCPFCAIAYLGWPYRFRWDLWERWSFERPIESCPCDVQSPLLAQGALVS